MAGGPQMNTRPGQKPASKSKHTTGELSAGKVPLKEGMAAAAVAFVFAIPFASDSSSMSSTISGFYIHHIGMHDEMHYNSYLYLLH